MLFPRADACRGSHILSENLERIFPGNLVCIFPAGNLTQEEASRDVRTELLSCRDVRTGLLSCHLRARAQYFAMAGGPLQCSARHSNLILISNFCCWSVYIILPTSFLSPFEHNIINLYNLSTHVNIYVCCNIMNGNFWQHLENLKSRERTN